MIDRKAVNIVTFLSIKLHSLTMHRLIVFCLFAFTFEFAFGFAFALQVILLFTQIPPTSNLNTQSIKNITNHNQLLLLLFNKVT